MKIKITYICNERLKHQIMLEAPEAQLIALQLDEALKGRKITYVSAGYTPHKFAWYHEGPESYDNKMNGKTVGAVRAYGGMVEIEIDDVRLLLAEGVNVRCYAPGEKLPAKHQLLLGFDDERCLVVTVRMYGGMMCFHPERFEGNFAPYYQTARIKPQVMGPHFTRKYFMELFEAPGADKKSAKAFLATGQAIPGLGNGVLQDILYNACIHPKTKVSLLTKDDREKLFGCLRSTLKEMAEQDGRNSESDIFGRPGGYVPWLSKDTAGHECVRCGAVIVKENYMGGSVYFCPGCQKHKR